MIATCPVCAKRYRIADDAVPPSGRNVRCAACGAGWTVVPDDWATFAAGAPAADAVAAPQLPFDPAPGPAVAPARRSIDEGPVAPAASAAPAPPHRRRWWPVMLLLLVAVAAGGLAVVEFAPADTFDPPRLGLPAATGVDLSGAALPTLPPLDLTRIPLVGDRLDALVNPPPAPASPLRIAASGERRRLGNGTWLMTVTGSVTNPTDAPVALTGIDAALLDPAGHVAFRWHIAAPASVIAPHGSAAFESVAANFPAAATVLRLTVR